MELRILGPLEARHDGAMLPLGSRKQRIVLATLAVNAGRSVGIEQLIYELWGEHPIASAVENVRSYAAALRRLFGAAGSPGLTVDRSGSGYLLVSDPDHLDLLGYEADAARGREALANHDLLAAKAHLKSARSRWRGPILEDLPHGEMLSARCTVIERDLVSLTDELADLHLRVGQPAPVIGLMREQVREDPVRERSYELLMRATYQIDGPAAALEVYHTARRTLVEQLGVEPGERLQDLLSRVLDRDRELDLPRNALVARAPAPVPRQLPPLPSTFLGREAEVARGKEALTGTDPSTRRRPAVVVIYGPGGAGKSALATYIGHELAGEFPDGQLHVDLGSGTEPRRPTPASVVERILHALGLSDDQIPDTPETAYALVRTATAGKRLLLVLDNASGAEQVPPLLPGSGTCAVIVTSRRPLTSLDTDCRLRLTGLSHPDAVAMLTQLAQRSSLDPETASRIVESCGRLPLAIKIAAARLAARPGLPASEQAIRLAARPLDELQHDGLAVRTSIRSGFDNLLSDPEPGAQLAARVFPLLGLLPVPVQVGFVAALLGNPDLDAVRAGLDLLVEAQLLETAPAGRYRPHDLVREVAIELAAEHPSSDQQAQARMRALTYYAHGMQLAAHLTRSGACTIFHAPPAPAVIALPVFSDQHQAHAWMEAELWGGLAALEHTEATGEAERLTWLTLSERLWSTLFQSCRWRAAHRLGRLILETASRLPDREMAGWGHLACGRSEANLNNLERATGHLQQALDTMRAVGNSAGTVLALNALGLAMALGGKAAESLPYYEQAIELTQDDQWRPEFRTLLLLNRSFSRIMTGAIEAAASAATECIELARRHGFAFRLDGALVNLGGAHLLAGRTTEAERVATEAIHHCRRGGNQLDEREARLVRSTARLLSGKLDEALADAESVLTHARANGDRYAEAAALRQQANVLSALGQAARATRAKARAEAAYATLTVRVEPLLERLLDHCEDTMLVAASDMSHRSRPAVPRQRAARSLASIEPRAADPPLPDHIRQAAG